VKLGGEKRFVGLDTSILGSSNRRRSDDLGKFWHEERDQFGSCDDHSGTQKGELIMESIKIRIRRSSLSATKAPQQKANVSR